ncbi:PREDICTED: uncharacterized protein LOC106748832 isoform X2 [Dinoponera quadriceps]|uniref:Uncharacterized protein LOC106748832 isoform X2 n=1 Tax=Dinoponera quadriceps TaxID=609295 RepID=A0A6P3XZ35_DINQU|nr:PREDICTED: uncharacterized protein LOC106748832 isoform X2 [Dinoponera quadriceps]
MIITSTVSPLLKIGLRIFGVWPDVPYAAFRRLIHVLSILIVQYFQYLYIYAHCRLGELENFVESLPATFYYSLTCIKVMTLWIHHRIVREVLATMDTDWCECVNVDRHLHLMKRKARLSHFCVNIWLSLNTIGGVIYFGSNNAMAIMHLVGSDNNTSRPFPILHVSGQIDIISQGLKMYL